MKLSDQVCSLEQSKRLDELGVKRESLFFYQNNTYNDGEECIELMINECRNNYGENVIDNSECENENNQKYPAYTVAELGEMLPPWTSSDKLKNLNWLCITIDKNSEDNYSASSLKEANARAKLLIYLIENDCIKV